MRNFYELFRAIYSRVHYNYSPKYSTPPLDILEIEEFTKVGIDETLMVHEKAREILDIIEIIKDPKQKNLSEDKIERNWGTIHNDLLDILSLTENRET